MSLLCRPKFCWTIAKRF